MQTTERITEMPQMQSADGGNVHNWRRGSQGAAELGHIDAPCAMSVSLLTGGSDKPYVIGLTRALLSQQTALDLIGSDELDCPELRDKAGVNFLNLRGSTRSDASLSDKMRRIAIYYLRLVRYTATANPKIFHILWNNKFEFFDRTALMLYYRLLGKKIVFTVHNVNAGKRDLKDSYLNRITLRVQYRLAHHLFVHTEKMKRELLDEFGVRSERVTVIPFGINNAVPHSAITPQEAKRRLGLKADEKTVLFFGRITPYKGLDDLIPVFIKLLDRHENYRLVIAGRPAEYEEYWRGLRNKIEKEAGRGRILLDDAFIPDDEVEIYFKAADALILPYRDIYQSGVLFLGLSFGLPVLTADVGCLADEIVEGQNGFVFRPGDRDDLANAIERYFSSNLYEHLDQRRAGIRDTAARRHSWDVVGEMTLDVYSRLSNSVHGSKRLHQDPSEVSCLTK
jgi:D-inositol-3-phosphate glycosyltransferase